MLRDLVGQIVRPASDGIRSVVTKPPPGSCRVQSQPAASILTFPTASDPASGGLPKERNSSQLELDFAGRQMFRTRVGDHWVTRMTNLQGPYHRSLFVYLFIYYLTFIVLEF